MRALNRKLLRDLAHMRGQALAIALVLAAGIAMFVAYFGTFDSLEWTMADYYGRSRFADAFSAVKRAPLSLQSRLAAIEGVAQADVRVVVDVTLDVPGETEPLTGRLVSLALPRDGMLNDVLIRAGRDPAPGRDDEALVNEAFASARHLRPGAGGGRRGAGLARSAAGRHRRRGRDAAAPAVRGLVARHRHSTPHRPAAR